MRDDARVTAKDASPDTHEPLVVSGSDGLRVSGDATLEQGGKLWKLLGAALADGTGNLSIDVAGIKTIDGGGAALLIARARAYEQRTSSTVTWSGAAPSVAAMLDLNDRELAPLPRRPRERFLAQIGRVTYEIGDRAGAVLTFVGQLAAATWASITGPRNVNWRDLYRLVERAGADAVPIVLLINFLVGLITAVQAAFQLKPYGGDIFVADLVAKAMTREFGPLMTAIIVAGRSGAGFAAELGTMKVSEEIDALRSMGICHYCHLVLPRLLALVIAMPVLTVLANLLGIAGGLFTAMLYLDVTIPTFIQKTQSVLTLADVGTGLIKSVAFAFVIALSACERGLATTGGAEGVGRSTTSAVVGILFQIVFVNALFTILFQVFEI